MGRSGSRFGAALVSIGLVLIGLGAAVPAAATPSAPIDVCENQQGASSDCVDPAPVGTVTTEIVNGGIVFRFQAATGVQWSRLALCIPGSTPSPANDCDTTSAAVLDPAAGDYAVSGVTKPVISSTSVGFACTSSLTATVPRATLDAVANPIPWSVELTNCAGGSNEAFGTVERGSPSGAEYRCDTVADLTSTSATLRASTTDKTVTKAVFAFTEGSDATYTDENVADGISAAVSGLTPNTKYAYNVRFFTADGTKVASQGGCLFSTPAVLATTTTQPTTTTTQATTTTTQPTTTTTQRTTTTTTEQVTTTTQPTTTTTAQVTTTTQPTTTTTAQVTTTTQPTTTTTAQATTTTTARQTTTTTVQPTTTTTGQVLSTSSTVGETTTTTDDTEVLPSLLNRGGGGGTPILGAAAPAAAPQLARTGLATTLTTLGLSLIGIGSVLGFAGRRGRRFEELDPEPVAHPTVGLGEGPAAPTGARRPVVVIDPES